MINDPLSAANLESKELAEADKQIAMLFKIIDEDNKNFVYSDIINRIYDEPEEYQREIIRDMLHKANDREEEYQKFVKDFATEITVVSKVSLLTELVYKIKREFTYKKHDEDMLYFAENKEGKCWHISNFFKDACKELNIFCETIKGYADGDLHVWNIVDMGGYEFYFDLTWYINTGNTDYIFAAAEDWHMDRVLI